MPDNQIDTPTEPNPPPASPVGPFGVPRRRFIAWTGTAVAASTGAAVIASRFGSEQADQDSDPGAIPVVLLVNGSEHALELDPRTTLLDAVREQIGLTGTKKGCDHGQCTVHRARRRPTSSRVSDPGPDREPT